MDDRMNDRKELPEVVKAKEDLKKLGLLEPIMDFLNSQKVHDTISHICAEIGEELQKYTAVVPERLKEEAQMLADVIVNAHSQAIIDMFIVECDNIFVRGKVAANKFYLLQLYDNYIPEELKDVPDIWDIIKEMTAGRV